MSGYVSPPPPHPLGQHRPKIEKLRNQRGLTPEGFRQDGADPAASTKTELERIEHERANEKAERASIGAAHAADESDLDESE